jgi:hypothetical protein
MVRVIGIMFLKVEFICSEPSLSKKVEWKFKKGGKIKNKKFVARVR